MLLGGQLTDLTFEELVHEHLGHTGQHALSDAGQHAPDLTVALDLDVGTLAVRFQRDPGRTLDKARPAAAFNLKRVRARLFFLYDGDLALVTALDRRHSDFHQHVPVVGTGLRQRL